MMLARGWVGTLILGVMHCFAGAAAAQEAPTPAPEPPHRPKLAFDLSVGARYDDNILRLSNCDRDSVDSGIPRLPCANDPGHRASHAGDRLTTSDDNVVLAGFQGRWTTRPFPHRNTTVGASYDIYRYMRNPIKNWSEWSLTFAQELSASRKHLTLLRAWVDYVPSYYLRELRDDAASLDAGTPVYASATYAQTEYDLALEQEIVNNRMHAVAGAELERRDYNHQFDARDSDKTTWWLGLRGRFSERLRTQATLTYYWGRLAADGDLPSTPILERDISYDHRGIKLDGAVSWGDRRGGRVELLVKAETREFTTTDRFDVYRFGRVDHRREYRARFVQRAGLRFDIVAEWWRYESNPDLLIPSLDPAGDVTGYVENRYTVSLRCHIPQR